MPTPADIREFRRHAEWAIVVGTALEVGLLDALADGPSEPGELARRLELDERATRVVLGVLEEMGVCRTDPEGVRLTGSGRAHLMDRDTPDYEADSLRHWLRGIRRWTADLPRTLRSGRPEEEAAAGGRALDEEQLAVFMAAMHNKPPEFVELVADAVLAAAPGAATLLDLGGGPGTFSRVFARRGLQVTLLDRPEVVRFVRDAYGLEGTEGIELVPADFLEEIPGERWDIVLAANISHIYSPEVNRELLARVAPHVAPEGVLAILDFVRGRSAFAALFAVTMLLNTEGGGTYTLEEYRQWLAGSGLPEVRCVRVSPDADVILARRQPWSRS